MPSERLAYFDDISSWQRSLMCFRPITYNRWGVTFIPVVSAMMCSLQVSVCKVAPVFFCWRFRSSLFQVFLHRMEFLLADFAACITLFEDFQGAFLSSCLRLLATYPLDQKYNPENNRLPEQHGKPPAPVPVHPMHHYLLFISV